MSMKAVLWALYDVPQEKVRGAALRTLLVLADHADTKGKGAYPSQKRLCALTGYSRRTIQETLKDLENEGLIHRGDQRLVSHVAANYRPIVWDLGMDARNDRGAKTAPLKKQGTDAQNTAPLGAQSGAQKNDGRGAIRGAVCLRTEPNKEEPFIEPRESNARARKIGDWKPTPEHRALAARLGLDCEAEAAKFTDLALDQDAESADWDARFRNWLRRGHELGITHTTTGTGTTHRHTWKCAHTLQLLQRDETDALCDALACTVATALNEGADPQTITRAVRDGDIGRLRDLTWEPA
ncbi:helix-turn-helix domain-containing protein [Bifidobacterium sp. 64T4]|uniref:helix-turn-helix domain-containing protein n=1 Tax=Bifidobacterium pongonis TaxID=2834432 RepID=UPI001C56135E|nr:helix-turn-helix domain-containing protein [Bifidobacterium pongonis]MBW3095361.1 helix-turn-helix domain-containing protein [Bifidobacterium pongonis]